MYIYDLDNNIIEDFVIKMGLLEMSARKLLEKDWEKKNKFIKVLNTLMPFYSLETTIHYIKLLFYF